MMFCSTIIPTIGRDTLTRAVDSVLTQEFAGDELEVIVVNDSGKPLPAADWQQLPQVQVINTCRRERCAARNAGAAIARSKYLHFLDDDDILLPGAMAAFAELDRHCSDAVWLYGSYQTVDNSGALVATWHPNIAGDIFALLIAGESIPFQTSLLLNTNFFAVGMFAPDPAIIGVEDRDVGRRIAFSGRVAYTPTVVAQIRIGEQGSTTNWATLAERDRWGREKALCMQGATARLLSSTTSSYLHGRVSRAYWASAVWNLKRKNLFTAASRATAGACFAGLHILSFAYWQGLQTKIG